MWLFFHDIGIPMWLPPLFLLSLLASPVVFLGVRYLAKHEHDQVTVTLTFVSLIVLTVAYFAFDFLEVGFFAFLTFPFGSVVALLLFIWVGLPSAAASLIGFGWNAISIFGLIKFIEKRV